MRTDGQDAPLSAADTITRLEAENATLRRALEGEHFARDPRRSVTTAAAAGIIGSPFSHSRLLEMIVETAAQVISANAASLFLLAGGGGAGAGIAR